MGWVVNTNPRPLYHGNASVSIVQEAGVGSRAVLDGCGNLTSTEIRFLDRPARSESIASFLVVTSASSWKSERQNSKKTTALLGIMLHCFNSIERNEISWSYEGHPLRICILSAFAKWPVVTHTVNTNALCF
jgi:hypothetical protein